MPRAKKTKRTNLPKHHHSTYRARKVPVRLAHHAHTGRRLPFYCTSYAILFFLIVFASLFTLYISKSAQAIQQTGSISLVGVNKGNPPEIAARITSPKDSERFNNIQLERSQIEVSGTCLQEKYIEIYRNNTYAGTALCDQDGMFKLIITIVPGANELIAKTRDNFDQYGPNSEKVTIHYDVLPVVNPVTDPGTSTPPGIKKPGSKPVQSNLVPLMVYTDPTQSGVWLNTEVNIRYEINGGQPPYGVSIDWGDGTPASMYSHNSEGDFSASHVMKKAGQLSVKIQVLDAANNSAYIQTIIVVAGATDAAGNLQQCRDCYAPNEIELFIENFGLPLIIASLMTFSFWVGEKFMYTRLRVHHR